MPHAATTLPPEYWILFIGVLASMISKTLTTEKTSYKTLLGKLFFSVASSLALWHFGQFHQWPTAQTIAIGIFVSWGALEATSWSIKGIVDMLNLLLKIK